MTNATDAKVYAGIPLSEAVACGKRYAREEDKLRPRLAQTFDSLIAAVAALQAEVARLRSEHPQERTGGRMTTEPEGRG